MTVEELSNRILDGPADERYVGNAIAHAELAHYGILGMKWGIRRTPEELGHKKVVKKKEYETDQQYKERLDRESRERQAEQDRKAQAKAQKRTLKSQEKIKKQELKTQEKIKEKELNAQLKRDEANRQAQQKQQEKAAKEAAKKEKKKTKSKLEKNDTLSSKMMTDAELRDAINRMQMEKSYKQLTKKEPGLGKKAAKTAVAFAIPIGAAIVKRQLTKLGNDYADEKVKPIRTKLGLKNDDSGKKSGISEERVTEIIKEYLDGR